MLRDDIFIVKTLYYINSSSLPGRHFTLIIKVKTFNLLPMGRYFVHDSEEEYISMMLEEISFIKRLQDLMDVLTLGEDVSWCEDEALLHLVCHTACCRETTYMEYVEVHEAK